MTAEKILEAAILELAATAGQPDSPRVLLLKIELEVRTRLYPRPAEHPVRYRTRGQHSIFCAGFEAGWRGRAYVNPYDRQHFKNAFLAGYSQGQTEVNAAIRIALEVLQQSVVTPAAAK